MGCSRARRPARREGRTRTHSSVRRDPMAWFRSRKKVGAPPGKLRRWRRVIGRGLAAVLLFGVLVSVVGFCRAPAVPVIALPDSSARVTEVTGLYPITMDRVATPHSVAEIAALVASSPGPISIGGGRYSMGGQTATPDGVQLDLRDFHGVVALDTAARILTVHSGTRWREVQQAIDPAGLSVKIMQTYNTFTVGGALSVN